MLWATSSNNGYKMEEPVIIEKPVVIIVDEPVIIIQDYIVDEPVIIIPDDPIFIIPVKPIDEAAEELRKLLILHQTIKKLSSKNK
jgi:hypothetical protein